MTAHRKKNPRIQTLNVYKTKISSKMKKKKQDKDAVQVAKLYPISTLSPKARH